MSSQHSECLRRAVGEASASSSSIIPWSREELRAEATEAKVRKDWPWDTKKDQTEGPPE